MSDLYRQDGSCRAHLMFSCTRCANAENLAALRAQLAAAQERADEYRREVERREEIISGQDVALAAATERAERAEAARNTYYDAANLNHDRYMALRTSCNHQEALYLAEVEEHGKTQARLATIEAERDRLRDALRFQDPRNAAERYDRIADDFERETGLWPPGRSRAAAMGPDPRQEEAFAAWRKFCDAWHERWFDRALSEPAQGRRTVSEMLGGLEVVARYVAPPPSAEALCDPVSGRKVCDALARLSSTEEPPLSRAGQNERETPETSRAGNPQPTINPSQVDGSPTTVNHVREVEGCEHAFEGGQSSIYMDGNVPACGRCRARFVPAGPG